jgi:hypothetical protein
MTLESASAYRATQDAGRPVASGPVHPAVRMGSGMGSVAPGDRGAAIARCAG